MDIKYGLFAGHCYYPKGGAGDFKSFGVSIDELKRLYKLQADPWSLEISCYADPWGEIVNMSSMEIVCTIRGHGKWRKIEDT